MRPLVALFCVVALCITGCSFKAGAEQDALKIEYRGNVAYAAEDISEERAEWGVLEYRLSRTVGAGCQRQRTVQDYNTYVPYRFGAESGNFVQGVVSTILLPLTVPLFALSGSEPGVLGEHIKQIGHNLNIFLAAPPDDAYLFNTPVKRKPIGEPRQSGWEPVTKTRTMPLKNVRVEARIDSLGFSSAGRTDEYGMVSFDATSAAKSARIPEARNYVEVAVRLVLVETGEGDAAPVISVTSRLYCKGSGE